MIISPISFQDLSNELNLEDFANQTVNFSFAIGASKFELSNFSPETAVIVHFIDNSGKNSIEAFYILIMNGILVLLF